MRTFSFQWRLREDWLGLGIAIGIFGLWLSSLVALLSIDLSHVFVGWTILAILGRAFLHTGLFVIAHDAMHGNLAPRHLSINHGIGKIAVGLYASLPYYQCRINHGKHHRHPAQSSDPDFHDGIHSHPVRWYLKFIREYLPVHQMVRFLLIWGLVSLSLCQIWQVAWANLALFGLLPLLLSSVQLFCFGTYLPHRGARPNPVCAVPGDRLTVLWSFFECYHFGYYHCEHHQYPRTPWYRLPAVSRSAKLRRMSSS
jgi:beta-carotene/zeaxanthin 4-ketolase